MYVPDQYRPPAPSWTGELIRSFPLATLVTDGVDQPFATHLPAVLEEDLDGGAAQRCDLVGTRIFGHLDRANPHWTGLGSGAAAVLIFQGPHGYVSPTVYRTTPAAPTWNFTAVHVHGALRPIEDRGQTMWIVQATVRAFERRLGMDWDMSRSLDYFEKLLPGVGAFEVKVESVDGMFKLSQEQRPEIRKRVSSAFAGSKRGLHQELATMMNRLDGSLVR